MEFYIIETASFIQVYSSVYYNIFCKEMRVSSFKGHQVNSEKYNFIF